jgi:hypothetical protein
VNLLSSFCSRAGKANFPQMLVPFEAGNCAARNKCAAHTLASSVENPWGFLKLGCMRFVTAAIACENCQMNPAVLRQQMGHSSAMMSTRYPGEIPLDKVQEAFSKIELENMEVIGSGRAVPAVAWLCIINKLDE